MTQNTLEVRQDSERSIALTRRTVLLSVSGGLLAAAAPVLGRAEAAAKPTVHG